VTLATNLDEPRALVLDGPNLDFVESSSPDGNSVVMVIGN
jgi:hypothetical protein